ncbi:VOC family protein [Microbacterium sp. NPDC058389]|uniref:VOC family protein n=1 Tax=Microbacterium sp. NPDC058389 TaxID=3346475 RepID=UPI003669A10C
MLNGFATQNVYSADLDAAASWYSDVLGIEPYFRRPGYVEFRVGPYEHEFGIIDAAYRPDAPAAPGGPILYWQVDDVAAVNASLLERGASEFQPVTVRGEGFVTASVVDPFGNLLGVMENVHFAGVRERLGA